VVYRKEAVDKALSEHIQFFAMSAAILFSLFSPQFTSSQLPLMINVDNTFKS
jgi:hypothetical protein